MLSKDSITSLRMVSHALGQSRIESGGSHPKPYMRLPLCPQPHRARHHYGSDRRHLTRNLNRCTDSGVELGWQDGLQFRCGPSL